MQDPDPYTGRIYVVSGRICDVRIGPDRKAARVSSATGGLPLVFDKWYASNAGSADGRARIRELSKYDSCFTGARSGEKRILARLMQFNDTFEAYLELIDLKDAPTVRENTGEVTLKPREVIQQAPHQSARSLSAPRQLPPTRSPALARIEIGIPFAKQYEEHTVRVTSEPSEVFAAVKTAVLGLRETIHAQDVQAGTIITARKKHRFMGTPRQILVAVEPSDTGQSSLSIKVVYSFNDLSGNLIPVEDQKWINRNDAQIIDAITEELRRRGIAVL